MLEHTKPDASKIPGFYEPKIDFTLSKKIKVEQQEIQVLRDFLTHHDIIKLKKLFGDAPVREGVSIQGLKDIECGVGSYRTTMWSEELANMFSEKLKSNSNFPLELVTDKFSRTDAWQELETLENKWELVGFSPLLRFMEYSNGGEHYAHYDAGFIYPNSDYRTLKSVVIYLTSNETGFTRFIEDEQDHLEQSKRINLDWSREVKSNEVKRRVKPVAGSVLIFDHRLCHDVSKFEPQFKNNEKRIIIRGDLIYKRVSNE